MSLQANIVRRLAKRLFSGWFEGTIEEQRLRQERSSRFTRIPADIHRQPVSAGGVPAEWIEAPNADSGVFLYLHGGAYALGSINTHRELVARLSRALGLRGLAIEYRLAPEHPYPAALEDALTAYHWLIEQGHPSSRIMIAGDSAGGGLTLATLTALRDAGDLLPAGGVCLSPWTDLRLTGASIQSKADHDPILNPICLEKYAGYYAGAHDVACPQISPLYADMRGLPPLLIQVGTDEILLDDALRYADRAREAGVAVTLETWDEMFHVFQMIPILSEATEAIDHIAEFAARTTNRHTETT